MKSTTLTTPWQDESDLAMVRDFFYPDRVSKDPYGPTGKEDMRREAIAKVNIWTFKTHKTPPAILSTADLTDSILHYEDFSRTGEPDSYRAVQFMFAFAFLRFVNSFVDRDVARTATASLATDADDFEDDGNVKVTGESSMYAHAAAIAMPSRFVDLRHQISHGNLPELDTLRLAAEEAMDWLWNRWWSTNVKGDPATAVRRFEALRERRQQALSGLQVTSTLQLDSIAT